MKTFRISLLLACIFALATPASAQNLKGGEITFDWTNGNSVIVFTTVYTKTSLPQGQLSTVLNYGDGTTDTLVFSGGINLSYDATIYTINTTHIYPGPGVYAIHAVLDYRMPNLVNVNNSYTESLYLQASLTSSPLFGPNTSPLFVFNQSDITYNLGIFTHNANAVDANGDSIAYSLVHPGTTNYTYPNATVNPVTGLFDMPALNQFGAYAVAIRLDEFRLIGNQFVQISTTTRNMTIETPLVNAIAAADVENNTAIFPNPFSEYATLTLPETYASPVQLIITDLHGREMLREPVTGNTYRLQRNGMAAGIYLYRLENNGKPLSRGKISMQ